MILRIEESRSSGDGPGGVAAQAARTTKRKASDRELSHSNLAAIEMAVVLIVIALLMVSIILSSGCSNRQPRDLSATHTSQLRQTQAARAEAQQAGAQSGSSGLSGNAVETASIAERFEDAKRDAPVAEVTDLSVGP